MFDAGVVAHIAFFLRVFVAPLFGGGTEERNIEDIGLGGVDPRDLPRTQ